MDYKIKNTGLHVSENECCWKLEVKAARTANPGVLPTQIKFEQDVVIHRFGSFRDRVDPLASIVHLDTTSVFFRKRFFSE